MGQNQTKKWIDLHLHTSESDGTCSPSELIRLALKQKILTIAITDHDTVSGLKEGISLANKSGIRMIPGLEISADCQNGSLHILGLGIDPDNIQLSSELERLQSLRKERNIKIVDRLRELKIDVSVEELSNHKNTIKSVGRPQIAALLMSKKIVPSIDAAFKQYLSKNGTAFVAKEMLSPERTIQLIHQSGGKAVVAHPVTVNKSRPDFEKFIHTLIEMGLDGLEVYSSSHSRKQIAFLKSFCQENRLLISGGSDFHGGNKHNVKLGVCNSGKKISESLISFELLHSIETLNSENNRLFQA